MKILTSLNDIQQDLNSVVTVGTFDGVHRAHQKIFSELIRRARERKGRSVVVTFNPHPRMLVGRNAGSIRLLTTLEERIALIQKFEIDVVLIVAFTYEFSRLTPRQFYAEYVVSGIGVAEVIEGFDHTFGRDREAGITKLEAIAGEFGFAIHVIEPVMLDGDVIGSSKIRKYLVMGDVRKANDMLGRTYSAEGVVIEGEGRGRTIGFPTANIAVVGERKLLPANGVYAASLEMGGTVFPGMLNLGTRPTFTETTEVGMEIHLFDFNSDIYGKRVHIQFYDRIRDERRFISAESLSQQLERDAEKCRSILENEFHLGK